MLLFLFLSLYVLLLLRLLNIKIYVCVVVLCVNSLIILIFLNCHNCRVSDKLTLSLDST